MSIPDVHTLKSISSSDFPAAVRAALAEEFDARRPHLAGIGTPVVNAVSHLERFVLDGGKRIRPIYAWAGFVGAGGLTGPEDPQAVLRAVSSLELIQACALIHDDIIDSSDTRRGRPTVHRAVETIHRANSWLGDSGHFGTSVAILAGDLGLAWADDMLHDSGISAEAQARARQPWVAMRQEVIGGQILDIYVESLGSEDSDSAMAVNRFKTAAYTIERPLHIGAAIAGASEELIAAFRGYGQDIGVAFQLRDDLLGVFGEPAITGKPAGDDLREGKRTVLLAEAIKRASPAAAARLREGIGVVTDPADIAALAQIIEDSGAPEAVEKQITELTQSGLAHLDRADVADSVKQSLRTLAIRATERRK